MKGNVQALLGAKVISQSRLVQLKVLVRVMDLSRQEARPATSGQTVISQVFLIPVDSVIATATTIAPIARSVMKLQESVFLIQNAINTIAQFWCNWFWKPPQIHRP